MFSLHHYLHQAGFLTDGVLVSKVLNKFYHFQAHQTAEQKKEAAEESRKDYMSSLSQFNHDQYQHYHTLVPVIYQVR